MAPLGTSGIFSLMPYGWGRTQESEEIMPEWRADLGNDLIKVYRIGQSPIEVPRRRIQWVDRSRIERGSCSQARFNEYEFDGPGVTPRARNQHLVIGGTVHTGIDRMVQAGGDLLQAWEAAKEEYDDAPDFPETMLPEQRQILKADGWHLCKGLIYAFYVHHLPQLLEEYEVVAVEEEFNWLIKPFETPIPGNDGRQTDLLVMMCRPDLVLRHKQTGGIWVGSHKTTKRKDQLTLEKAKLDIQKWSEGFGAWARWGQKPEGTLFNHFIKGEERYDEYTDLMRYTNGLIRPYIYRPANGQLTPERVRFPYSWLHMDTSTGKVSEKRPPSGWERAAIYNEMNYETYLEWLREKWVQREGQDYLEEVISGMTPIHWEEFHATRWFFGIMKSEEEWAHLVHRLGDRPDFYAEETMMNLPLAPKDCFDYNRPCAFLKSCWEGVSLDSLLEDGTLKHREPNHIQEFYEIQ